MRRINTSSEKMMEKSNNKKKSKSNNCFDCQKVNRGENKRFLISVSVLGSAGPLRFLVNEEDVVGGVIDTALKCYAKERRLPILGLDSHNFLLYSPSSGFLALRPWDEIGSCGARNFVLCKKANKQQASNMSEARSEMLSRHPTPTWKAWLNKSLTFKI